MSDSKEQECFVKEGRVGVNTEYHESDSSNAIEKDGNYKRYLIVAVLCCGTFSNGALSSLQNPLLPKEVRQKGASLTQYGIIRGAYPLSVFISAMAFGHFFDHIGAKVLAVVSSAIVGLAGISFGFLTHVQDASTFVMLCFLVRSVGGAGASIFRISRVGIGAVQFPDKTSTVYTLLKTTSAVGLTIGPLIGGALFDIGGFKLPFIFGGTMLLIVALISFLVLPSQGKKKSKKKKAPGEFWHDTGVCIFFMNIFCTYFIYGSIIAVLEPHLRVFRLSGVNLGLVFSLNGAIVGISTPIIGWILDKKNISNLIIVTSGIAMICGLLFIGPMPFLHIEKQLWIVVVSGALLALSTSTTQIASYSSLVKNSTDRGFEKEISTYSLVSAALTSGTSLGKFLGPSSSGYFIETIGFNDWCLILLSAKIFAMLVIFWYLANRKISDENSNNHEKRRHLDQMKV